VKQTKLEPGC